MKQAKYNLWCVYLPFYSASVCFSQYDKQASVVPTLHYQIECTVVTKWLIFFLKSSHEIPHISPVRYGCIWGTNSYLCFASITAVMHATPCYIGPRYYDTRLHFWYTKWTCIWFSRNGLLDLLACWCVKKNVEFCVSAWMHTWPRKWLSSECLDRHNTSSPS